MYSTQKIKTKNEILFICNELRDKKKIIVTTNGSFDMLHYAHISLLERAKNEGDCLIVLLNSDSSIKKLKGEKRPIISQKERAAIISSIGVVDYVVIFDEDNPLSLLNEIKPNKHIKGGSFIESNIYNEKKLLESFGGEFKNLELIGDISTTNIINKILKLYGKQNQT